MIAKHFVARNSVERMVGGRRRGRGLACILASELGAGKKDIVMADYWCDEDFDNDQQKDLFELLRDEKGEDFAVCYHCCLKILNDFNHPEKLHVAAYTLRELMDRLGQKPPDDKMWDRVQKLYNEWQCLRRVVSDDSGQNAEEQNCTAVQEFLGKSDEFFSWYEQRSTGTEQMRTFLIESDPGKL